MLPDVEKFDWEWKLDRGATRVSQDGGNVILLWGKGRDQAYELGVDPASGEILWEQPSPIDRIGKPHGNQQCPIRIGNRVLVLGDAAHSPRTQGLMLYELRDRRVHNLGIDTRWSDGNHQPVGGYEVPAIFAAADGRIYFRSFDGHVVCYDLRAE